MERDDDPGPSRNYFTDSDYRMLPDEHETVDKKGNGTVGLSYHASKPTRLDGFGSLLCRMGVLLPQPSICLPIL